MTAQTVSGTVFARNLMDGPTIMALDPKGTITVEWEGANDPNGGDIQIIPDEIAHSAQYQRAIRKGVIAEVGAEEAEASFQRQNAHWAAEIEQNAGHIDHLIDRSVNNDYLMVKCIGPGRRANEKCDVELPLRMSEKFNKPPLCSDHQPMASLYVPSEVIGQGPREVQWTLVVTRKG